MRSIRWCSSTRSWSRSATGRSPTGPFYVAIGVTSTGERDILGHWAGDGGEGAKYWLQVLTEIKNRGVEDVCIVVCDGLAGLPAAINTVAAAVVQTCVLHLIRNTFRYACRRTGSDGQGPATDLHRATEAAAVDRFDEFAEHLGGRYPAIVTLWRNAWSEFVPFLDYDVEIRKVICSTNAIESINARYRRAVKARGHFPTEQAGRIQRIIATVDQADSTSAGSRPASARTAACVVGR